MIEQGIYVYLIDHQSTDDTAAAVESYLGRGLLAIERFPPDSNLEPTDFGWESILRRREALAGQLDADWFIHHDADEFRESPWPHLTLQEAIETVDSLGYNAIDFEILNFWPTNGAFKRSDDIRERFRYYESGIPADKIQVKYWKNLHGPIDLVSNAGHDVGFDGKKVFPLRFVLRHYPIRSQAHGERKILVERRRFDDERRRLGWHTQYDHVQRNQFIRDLASLTAYDPLTVRISTAVRHRGIEQLEKQLETQIQHSEGEIKELRTRIEQLETEKTRLREHLDAVFSSNSWKITAPYRAVRRFFNTAPQDLTKL